jgi:cell wall-associated NlpC family hydrolase
MDALTREKVVLEALSWKGTPYAHNKACKGVGADCALFPLAVYEAVGVLKPGPVPEYSPQWFLHHSEEMYMQGVLDRGGIETDERNPGDFALWRIGRCYSHGAIIIKWPVIIHAVRPRSVMTADATNDGNICRRPFKVFSL